MKSVPESRESEHRWLGYADTAGDEFVAVCSCGWRSEPYSTAGLAGAAADQHRAHLKDHDQPREDPGNRGDSKS